MPKSDTGEVGFTNSIILGYSDTVRTLSDPEERRSGSIVRAGLRRNTSDSSLLQAMHRVNVDQPHPNRGLRGNGMPIFGPRDGYFAR